MTKVEHPAGTWPSPITPREVAAVPGAPQWPTVVGAETWWCAPDPGTATVGLMRHGGGGASGAGSANGTGVAGGPATSTAGEARPVLGPDWPVGTKAIGYGGRPFLATPDLAVFSCSRDQRLYLVADVPEPLTPVDPEGVRTNYADPILGPTGTEVWVIRETQRLDAAGELTDPAPRTTREIVAVPLSGAGAADPDALRVVARSHHFLSTIRVSPDGRRLAWLGWDHPVMPWETTDLMVAEIVDGVAGNPARVLGGDDVAVCQAEWADADTLYALADPDGWWNLFRIDLGADKPAATCVLPTETECGHAIWRVGSTSFAVTDAGIVLRRGLGEEALILWDPETGTVSDLALEWNEFATFVSSGGGSNGGISSGTGSTDSGSGSGSVSGSGGRGRGTSLAVVASNPTEPPTPLRIDLATRDVVRCVDRPAYPHEAWVSVPQRRHVQVADGWQVPYIYHPPTSPEYRGPADTPPPLLVDVHGGPTSSTVTSRSLSFALFTSRGYAVASVDYGGSTGYGRAYRDRLRHTWGVTDVEDSVAVARALAAAGLADPARTAIRGGSAGGWTTLAALAHSDYFACGAVYYPISDPATWRHEQTHDFESRYIHYLVGDPDQEAEHFARVSPLAHAAEITAPFLMLQGLDDVICRPDQARRLVEAVEAVRPGLCRAHLEFPGEGHGFRKDETMAVCLQAELDLYAAVLGA